MTKATWKKGKKKIHGHYKYRWASDKFVIYLDSKDPITGLYRVFDVYGEKPEWNDWELQGDYK